MINYLKSSLWTLIILLGGTILLTILNYFNIVSGTFLNILEYIITIISIAVGAFLLGKSSLKKGYI